MTTSIDWNQLLDAALAARLNSYSPFSHFPVGAALLTVDGSVYAGCNVENSSYGLTICAERNALAAAVADGHREFTAIAVIAERHPPAQPCGMCLQTLAEFVPGDFLILLADTAGERRERRLRDFLPDPFQFRRDKRGGEGPTPG
jgi:cytidine deaminase